jgi:hypothetical protein
MRKELLRTTLAPAGTTELDAVTSLLTPAEAPVSDAPLFAPQAKGGLLLGLLETPKEPKEPKNPKKV